MHIPSLAKIHSYLLKLSSQYENKDRETNGWTDRHIDDKRETIIPPPRHYRVAGYKNSVDDILK